MGDILALMDWLQEHPGYEVDLRYIFENSTKKGYWILYVINPKKLPGDAKFKITDMALSRIIDILDERRGRCSTSCNGPMTEN